MSKKIQQFALIMIIPLAVIFIMVTEMMAMPVAATDGATSVTGSGEPVRHSRDITPRTTLTCLASLNTFKFALAGPVRSLQRPKRGLWSAPSLKIGSTEFRGQGLVPSARPNQATPVLSISKVVTPANNIRYHSAVTYTVQMSNTGQGDATTLRLTDTLPLSTTFARWVTRPDGATVNSDQITWTGGLSAAKIITFTFVVSHTGDYGDVVVNTAEYGYEGGRRTAVATFTVEAQSGWVYLPFVFKASTPGCPTTSTASFALIPIAGLPADHPDDQHGDLNLALRGYAQTNADLNLKDYGNTTDFDPPQLAGLFSPNQFPGITTVYQVNDWDWNCGQPHGCRGAPITQPEVTLIALPTTPGQKIHIPERSPEIYGGGYKAMVLYADAEGRRITLGYSREDSVAPGYAVHIENVCVDPNLLALYQAQTTGGWHNTGRLPALANNQLLGTAFGQEIQVAIRDKGSFMDPRSTDWWKGY